MKKPKISILLAAYKSEGLLEKVFIPSFIQNSQYDTQLVIYDNGGNGAFLSTMKTNILNNEEALFRIIGDSQNIGLNAALNKCAEVATGEYFYLPHSDMHLLPGWDTALLGATRNHAPGTQLLCSRSIEKHSHIPTQLLKDFGTTIENFKKKELYEFFKTYNDKGIVTSYRMPFFFHRKLLDKMHKFNKTNGYGDSPFDNKLFSFRTDDDLFMTAYHVGVRTFHLLNASVVYHLSGHSNNQQGVDKDQDWPLQYFQEKWNKLGYDSYLQIDKFVQSLCPWNVKIN